MRHPSLPLECDGAAGCGVNFEQGARRRDAGSLDHERCAAERILQAQFAALFGCDLNYGNVPVFKSGAHHKGALSAQAAETDVSPGCGNRGKNPYHASLALQQHFLDAGSKSKVALQCKGPIGELRFTRL